MASGCAKKQGVKYSGFLENYPSFQPGSKGGVDLVYLKEGIDFKAYDKIMMDPAALYFKKDAEYSGIHPDKLKRISDEFHKSMAGALKGAYPLVEKPGKDVLRIRVAITNVAPRKEAMRAYPAGSGAVGMMPHVSVGQASMEAELLDSLTNERIGAAIDTRAGAKTEATVETKKWKDVKAAFDFWAKRLRMWLDEQHGR
jgi:hypothetical protein